MARGSSEPPSHLPPRRLQRRTAPGTLQADNWARLPVLHLGGGGDDWRGPLPHPHCVVPAAPLESGLDSGDYCSHPPPWGGHGGSPTDACKVSLARGAARTQAPRWRCGRRCLASAIPTLPVVAQGGGGGGDTHPLHAAGCAGRAGRRGDSPPESRRWDPDGWGSPGCAATVVCGGPDCFSNRAHSRSSCFGSRPSLEFSSDPGRSRSPGPAGSESRAGESSSSARGGCGSDAGVCEGVTGGERGR